MITKHKESQFQLLAGPVAFEVESPTSRNQRVLIHTSLSILGMIKRVFLFLSYCCACMIKPAIVKIYIWGGGGGGVRYHAMICVSHCYHTKIHFWHYLCNAKSSAVTAGMVACPRSLACREIEFSPCRVICETLHAICLYLTQIDANYGIGISH